MFKSGGRGLLRKTSTQAPHSSNNRDVKIRTVTEEVRAAVEDFKAESADKFQRLEMLIGELNKVVDSY